MPDSAEELIIEIERRLDQLNSFLGENDASAHRAAPQLRAERQEERRLLLAVKLQLTK